MPDAATPGPVLILAPTGRDTEGALALLDQSRIAAAPVASLDALCAALGEDTGAILIADESLAHADLSALEAWIDAQPPWSDLPFVVLTSPGAGTNHALAALRLPEQLGNVMYLERPLHPATLVSAVRAALRARQRQLQLRDYLTDRDRQAEALAASREELRLLNAELEARVAERSASLERAQAALAQSQKMEAIGQLTGGIAHDFNNLLAAVLGNLNLLRKRLRHESAAVRLIDGAIEGAERGASLTRRLLAFARQQDLKPAAVDTGKLVRGMIDMLHRSIGPMIDIEIDIPPELWPARVDANQLELALLNLTVNARDAMPDGGTLRLSARNEVIVPGTNGAARSNSVLGAGQFICLAVTDTGSGMDEPTLARATDPFFTTKGIGKGTGLGLSMVHGMAAQSGGELRLRSRSGEGTTAELWLPRAQESPATITKIAATPMEATQPLTVLLVDDDALISMAGSEMLQDLGHHVIEAPSGRKALDILRDGAAIDLVVTDQAMPGMTGMQLADEIRTSWPDLPIILATGYAELPKSNGLVLPRLNKPYSQ
jgi:signal transduction histidine kinase